MQSTTVASVNIGSSHVLKLYVLSQEMPSHVDVTRGLFVRVYGLGFRD